MDHVGPTVRAACLAALVEGVEALTVPPAWPALLPVVGLAAILVTSVAQRADRRA